MATYKGVWVRTEYYTIWGDVEAESLEEASEKGNRGEYTETLRECEGCLYEEMNELYLEKE